MAGIGISSFLLNTTHTATTALQMMLRHLENPSYSLHSLKIPPVQLVARESTEKNKFSFSIIPRLHAYLEKNYHRALTINEIAEAMGVSRRVLERRLQSELNSTPRGELNDYRLTQSRRLLQEGHWDLETIAQHVDFTTSRLFSELFRKKFAQSPRQFRRKLKAEKHHFPCML